MGAISSYLAVIAGVTAAHASCRVPLRRESLETAAGVLLIAGLAMIGNALPSLP